MDKKIITLILWISFALNHTVSASEWFPEIEGWEMQENERIYHSGDLWELINGAAEAFLGYGFVNLHLAEYNRNDQIIRVEIYQHSSKENAYGIYSSERMPDYRQMKIGAQGYSSTGIVNFFAGLYYVKIMTVGLADVDEDIILMVADMVESHMDQQPDMPETISLLPEEGMEYLSDTYIASNFLGYGFLHSAYTARYNSDGNLFQLFIIQSSSAEIQNMLTRYTSLMKEDKFQKTDSLYIINDPFNGTVFLIDRGEYLIGVANTDNEQLAVDYMNKVVSKLP